MRSYFGDTTLAVVNDAAVSDCNDEDRISFIL